MRQSIYSSALCLLGIILSFVSPATAQFGAGDVIVTQGQGSTSLAVQYSFDGTVKQTFPFTSSSARPIAAEITPDRNLAVLWSESLDAIPGPEHYISVFDSAGSQLSSIALGAVGSGTDLDILSDGTYLVSDISNVAIYLYSSTGTYLGDRTQSGAVHGVAVGLDDRFYWSDDANKRVYSSTKNLDSASFFNVTNFNAPGIAVDPNDGTLWLSGDQNGTSFVRNYSTTGTLLSSFSVEANTELANGLSLLSIDVAETGSIFLSASQAPGLARKVFEYSPTGTLLDSFELEIPSQPNRLTVVEAAPPEPFVTLDTEPTNNTVPGADPLGLSPNEAAFHVAKLATGGSDVDHFSAQLSQGQVLLGITVPLSDLPDTITEPETVVSVMEAGTPITFSSSVGASVNIGDNSANSSLFRAEAQADETYQIAVSGSGDKNFNGLNDNTNQPHGQTGHYALLAAVVDPNTLGGDFADTDFTNDERAGADLINIAAYDAAVAVNNLVSGEIGDVDFFAVYLNEGDVLTAMTAPLGDLSGSFSVPDTLLAIFDAQGNLILVNDDSGDANSGSHPSVLGLDSDNPSGDEDIYGSALHFFAQTAGLYYIGVTGYGDNNFVGDHSESGRYALLVGVYGQFTPPVIPEPASATLLTLAAAALTRRRRR
jgi:hypothetical protein